MDIVDTGRFCQSCQKSVVDFTQLSNDEIIAILSVSDKVCGRFNPIQLNSLNAGINIAQTTRFSWKRLSLAAAAFISFLSFSKVEAKAKPAVEHHPVLFKEQVNSITDTVKEFRVITGVVTDSLKSPLPGVRIFVKGTKFMTTTDQSGRFSLTIPASPMLTGVVGFIGFVAQEFKINHQINDYSFVLKEDHRMMGEVVVTGYSKPEPVKPVKAVKQK
jgi:hypothetical protein